MTRVRGQLAPAALAALAAHAAALGWLWTLPPPATPKVRMPPAAVKLATRPPPPAPKPPEPAPEPKPAQPAQRTAKAEPRAAKPPPAEAPPPAPTPQPEAPKPAPRRFAVSMEATVPGGGVAVPTTEGRTSARGRADLPSSAPVGNNEGPTSPVDVVEVERAPRLLRQPSAADLRALYPEAARREQLETDVALQLLVDAAGKVADVRVLRASGNGFDEAAVTAARGIRFQPAERGGKAVAVWIPWTMKFRLDS
ncbi:MAG: TonB family protein [Anaeromyxobacteraceae bacterium]